MDRLAALTLSALLSLGCAREPREVTLRLRPSEALTCRPTAVRSVVLQPLGDSPARDRPSFRLDLSGISTIDSFAPGTHSVSVLASGDIGSTGGSILPWTGGGIVVLEGTDQTELAVPLLMLRRSCSLSVSDSVARAPPGSAVTTLPDGRLVIAGGHGVEGVLRLVTLGFGERLATAIEVAGSRPRFGLSATPLGRDLLFLAGGGVNEMAFARETYEIVRVSQGVRVSDGQLAGPRRDHGAARLPDGRVLLVGGRNDVGAVRADAELGEVSDDGTEAIFASTTGLLGGSRVSGEVLVLDDGTVLVLGGADASSRPVARVERFDPDTETFETLGTAWGARADADYVPLLGGRVARVGGRDGDGWSREVDVLLDRGETHVPLGAVLAAALVRPRGLGLHDGRLLVVGGDGTSEHVQIVDPGGSRDEEEELLPPIEASRAATHLVHRVDGSIAELDDDGISLLRLDLASVFSDPAASINPVQTDQRHELSFDACPAPCRARGGVGRWDAEGDLLVAQAPGARFDLPSSRFASVALDLEASGSLEVLLTVVGAAPIRIAVDTSASARYGACEVRLNGALRIEREGARLRLASGGASAECDLPEGLGRVGIAIRSADGGGVRRLAVTRR